MALLDLKTTQELEERYDTELKIRKLGPAATLLTLIVLVPFAIYHYYTAGTGIPPQYWHEGIHLAGVLAMVFVSYPFLHTGAADVRQLNRWWRYSGVPIWDWVCALAGVAVALYIGVTWRGLDLEVLGLRIELDQQALRQGNPAPLDIVMGTICIVLVLEATRRTLGPLSPWERVRVRGPGALGTKPLTPRPLPRGRAPVKLGALCPRSGRRGS